MRVLKIRFANLNSLAGEWALDFTHPAFAAEGIFTISGPTGSGKSTILDALCLALYGKTPRLERISASENEIMSRNTGFCFAEVIFSCSSGDYCCHFSQHRAKKSPQGSLQEPKRELSRYPNGEILATKTREVEAQVQEITGMDFFQFTRTMLLAQGAFAAFLQAGADARSPILEKITGTAIYSEISCAVHQRRRDEQEKLRLLEESLDSIRPLSPEEEEGLRNKHEVTSLGLEAQQKILALQKDQLLWLEKLLTQQADLAQLRKKWLLWQQQWQAWQGQSQSLALARKALEIQADFRELVFLRQKYDADNKKMQELQKQLPQKVQEQTLLAHSQEQALEKLQQARERKHLGDLVLQEVRALEQSLLQGQQPLEQARIRCRQLTEKEKEQEKVLLNLKNQLKKIPQDIQAIKKWQAERPQSSQDLRLMEEWFSLEAKCNLALNLKKQSSQKDLDSARSILRSGSPCPLCGSVEHPYGDLAKGAEFCPDAGNIINAYAALKLQEKELVAELLPILAFYDLDLSKLGYSACLKHLEERRTLFMAKQEELNKLELSLQALSQEWKLRQEQKTQLLEEKEQATKALAQQEVRLRGNQKEQQALLVKADTKGLPLFTPELGEKEQEHFLTQALNVADKAAQTAQETLRQVQNSVLTLQAQQAELQTSLALQLSPLEQKSQSFSARALQKGFATEEAYMLANLPEEKRNLLERQEGELVRTKAELEVLLQHTEQAYTKDHDLYLVQYPCPDATSFPNYISSAYQALLQENLKQLEVQTKALHQDLGAINQSLQHNKALRKQWHELSKSVEAQKKSLGRWQNIHTLIGSNDGKKYRNFAQTLAFEHLLAHTNIQLGKMTDRYHLLPHPENKLEILVCDQYQAGEVRSTRTLSGGESFLVCLALALGLSHMSGKNVRVDTLFLDEGFGSLDEDTLESVIDTLTSLRHEGKTIGLISHVGALKDRLPLSIEVRPQSGGRSTIIFPRGCQHLETPQG